MFLNKNKVLAIASPGGHWIQLNKICNPLEEKYAVIYASPATQYKAKNDPKSDRKFYNILDAAADSKIKLIPLAVQLLFILLKERPGTIISTGAAPGVVAILLSKLLGMKSIWVDSIANVKIISRSGRMIKPYASLFLTQWKPLSQADDKAQFQGAVL